MQVNVDQLFNAQKKKLLKVVYMTCAIHSNWSEARDLQQ